MDTAIIKQQVLKFNKARNNLLAVVAFTVINLLLTAFNADIYLLFSATAPQLIFEVGRGLAEELQSNVFLIIGFIVAFVVIILYFICWLFAKRLRAFILVALILFSIDTLIFVLLTLAAGFDVSYLLDIGFHGWILFYLISGVMAWTKLRGVNADDFNAALQEIAPTTTGMQSHNASLTDKTITNILQQDESEDNTPVNNGTIPLRIDDKKGRILIAANYEDLQISMKRTLGLTELIINGNVYDEVKGTIETEYSLIANVQNIKIIGMYKSTRSHMYLYANDVLIAKKLRLY